MSKKEVFHPDKKVNTGAYSSAVLADGWLFLSGQVPLNYGTGEIVKGTIEEETRLVLTHIGKILNAAGCTYNDVVKCTVHLADLKCFDRFNNTYKEFFTGVLPARTTVQSVLIEGINVEIDCIAKVPNVDG